jgi:hypothetical protein
MYGVQFNSDFKKMITKITYLLYIYNYYYSLVIMFVCACDAVEIICDESRKKL